jgi:aspartate aminotransferase
LLRFNQSVQYLQIVQSARASAFVSYPPFDAACNRAADFVLIHPERYSMIELSNRIRLARPLATTALHGRVEQLKARGQQIIDLSIALSNHPAPGAVLECTAEGLRTVCQPYTSVAGAEHLRARLVEKVHSENHIDAKADEIIVTNGAKQAVFEALYALTDPGDEVIIFRPYWPAYIAAVELLGLRPILTDLPAEITSGTLAALPRAKVIIINSPHNPTGRVFSASELSCLKDWIASGNSYAICDESYEKLVFEGEHVSFAARCDWRELGIVTIFSASQSYAMMGWRVGFAVAPTPVVRAMETLQGPITAAASALTQIAAEAAFSSGDPKRMLEDYRDRRSIALDLFANVRWLKMHSPAAGPYLWGDVSALTTDTVAFAEALLEQEKIAVMPGEALGVPGYIRLSFISDDADTLRRGVKGIIRFGDRFAHDKGQRL